MEIMVIVPAQHEVTSDSPESLYHPAVIIVLLLSVARTKSLHKVQNAVASFTPETRLYGHIMREGTVVLPRRGNSCPSLEREQLSFHGEGTVVLPRRGNSCPSTEREHLSFLGEGTVVLPWRGNICPSLEREQLSFLGEGTFVLPGRGNICPSREREQLSFRREATVVLPERGNSCPSEERQPLSFLGEGTVVLPWRGNSCSPWRVVPCPKEIKALRTEVVVCCTVCTLSTLNLTV